MATHSLPKGLYDLLMNLKFFLGWFCYILW